MSATREALFRTGARHCIPDGHSTLQEDTLREHA